jgi:hypothetical protein
LYWSLPEQPGWRPKVNLRRERNADGRQDHALEDFWSNSNEGANNSGRCNGYDVLRAHVLHADTYVTMSVSLSRPTYIVLASSSFVVVTWRLLQWRARKRAKKTVERVKDMVREGAPLIDCSDPQVRERILTTAIRRASNWMSLSEDNAKPMVGQVGGVSIHKKPLLTLAPDYVLKPLLLDHRGIREIAFYEAIRILSQNPSKTVYANFLTGGKKKQSAVNRFGEVFDTLALALAIFMQDSFVVESEVALKEAWKSVKREIEEIRRLANVTAPYYGVMGQRGVSASPDCPLGISEGAHLLLNDLTINFSKPCVMDLKMGTQTYEPDAPEEKRLRESGKYLQQEQFGFRIVGMRIYDPKHPDADTKGFRHFDKSYGRSLTTRETLLEALSLFFSAGIKQVDAQNGDAQEKVRTRAISNMLLELRPLRRFFDENKSLRFYASSLLIVYEGDVSKENTASIKMIDFGRVRRDPAGDLGCSIGLRTLKHMLTDVLEEEEERQRDSPDDENKDSHSSLLL